MRKMSKLSGTGIFWAAMGVLLVASTVYTLVTRNNQSAKFNSEITRVVTAQTGAAPDQVSMIRVPVSNIAWACGTAGGRGFIYFEGADTVMTEASMPPGEFAESWKVHCER